MFVSLDAPRACPSWLPPELADFYSRHAAVKQDVPPDSDINVLLFDLDEVTPSTAEDVRDLRMAYEDDGAHQHFRGLKVVMVGSSVFGDEIIYVPPGSSIPCGVYALGPDVSGPIDSPVQPSWMLRLAPSFQEWVERVGSRGYDFGLVPGEQLPPERRREFVKYFALLNPGIDWTP